MAKRKKKSTTKSATKTKTEKKTEEKAVDGGVDDKTVAKEVRAALRSDSRVSAGSAKVSVKDGKVTLEGRVPAYRRKKDIFDIVEEIRGVKEVIDRIQVRPASKAADDDLRKEVHKALKADTDIPANNISVVVKKGVATLSGYVPSTPQWQKASDAVESVKGILEVKNMLLVDPKIVRDDREIAKDVVRTLYRLDDVDASNIEVSVVGGQVNLKGKINSLVASKRVAKAAAGIRSVKQVVNKLKVK